MERDAWTVAFVGTYTPFLHTFRVMADGTMARLGQTFTAGPYTEGLLLVPSGARHRSAYLVSTNNYCFDGGEHPPLTGLFGSACDTLCAVQSTEVSLTVEGAIAFESRSQSSSRGAGPNSLSTHPSGQVAVANYAGGTAALVGFDSSSGRFSPPTLVTTAVDAGRSQVHFVSGDAACGKNAALLVVDAGALAILAVDGAARTNHVLRMPDRPRQIRLHPRLPIAYVVYESFDAEASIGIWGWPYCSNFSRMRPTEMARVILSRSGSPRLYWAAQFVLAPKADFAYVCSRWPGFVSVLAVSPNGSLTPVQHVSLTGSNPRDCMLTEGAGVLLVTDASGDQMNGSLTSFVRDADTGLLRFGMTVSDVPGATSLATWSVAGHLEPTAYAVRASSMAPDHRVTLGISCACACVVVAMVLNHAKRSKEQFAPHLL